MGFHFGTSFVKGFRPITTKIKGFDSKHTKVDKNYFVQKVWIFDMIFENKTCR